MKKLIENSIEIYGMGHPDTKTIFHLKPISENPTQEEQEQVNKDIAENERITKSPYFKSLITISGRKLSVFFNVEENGEVKPDKLQLQIIKSGNEQEIKEFILNAIEDYLK
jgi:hypothetical protein